MLITTYKGRMLKPCPGTPQAMCCNYHILNPVLGCPFDCTYCALQIYFNNPLITVYTNLADLFAELDARLKRTSAWLFRIGTGELTDSLALDRLTGINALLIPYFADKEHVLFELKTKSDQVESLLPLKHGGHTVMAWSLNPPSVIQAEENGTASLEDRLTAARQCQEAGYRLAFHFDPIICYSGWEREYQEVVERLFRSVDHRRIAWISLGTFRFPAHLRSIIRERHPGSRLVDEEFVPGQDGKMRYLKPLRVEIYRHMLQAMRSCSRDVFVYLCMEGGDVWRKVFGSAPESRADLARMFHC
jgi:spore photoproduct lyase